MTLAERIAELARAIGADVKALGGGKQDAGDYATNTALALKANIDRADRASIQPTLDLDFARQKYRVLDGAAGLKQIALADILTYTGSGRTYVDSMGMVRMQASNVPRLEFNPTSGAGKGLSVWGSRTNLLVYSEQFDNSAWTKSRVVLTANATTAPDGTLTADKVVEDTQTGAHYFFRNVTLLAGNIYVLSIFFKALEGSAQRYATIGLPGGSPQVICLIRVNTLTGEIAYVSQLSAGTYGVESLPNGWFRGWVQVSCATTVATTVRPALVDSSVLTSNSLLPSMVGDGFSGAYIWGAQLEVGVAPSPYIPTLASAVTVPDDVPSITGESFSKWCNKYEGTFVIIDDVPGDIASGRHLSLSSGVNTTAMQILNDATTVAQRRFDVVNTSVEQAAIVYGEQSTGEHIFAGAYKLNDFAASADGGGALTDTAGTIPTVDRLNIMSDTTGANQANGTVARLLYFPRRLTNAELQALSAR